MIEVCTCGLELDSKNLKPVCLLISIQTIYYHALCPYNISLSHYLRNRAFCLQIALQPNKWSPFALKLVSKWSPFDPKSGHLLVSNGDSNWSPF